MAAALSGALVIRPVLDTLNARLARLAICALLVRTCICACRRRRLCALGRSEEAQSDLRKKEEERLDDAHAAVSWVKNGARVFSSKYFRYQHSPDEVKREREREMFDNTFFVARWSNGGPRGDKPDGVAENLPPSPAPPSPVLPVKPHLDISPLDSPLPFSEGTCSFSPFRSPSPCHSMWRP